ncbi:MAG: hypothetical protein A2Z90_14235 [Burkholderiales bacterium GWA2_64_37]|nr:MAG: hypothetical protein A2Z90_14235 [Burkholderiales bacterium GWA2_64_37]
MIYAKWKILMLACAVLHIGSAMAADPPTARSAADGVRIALVAPLSQAPQSPIGQQVAAGVKSYVEQVNSTGGIQGKPVQLLVYDDHFKPDETAALSAKAVREDGALALMTVGTATALKVIEAQIPETTKTPLFPLRTGAASVREPLNPFVFNIRAGYRAELQRLVRQLDLMGIRRVALLYQNDAYGEFGRSVVRAEMQARNSSPLGEAQYDRTSADMTAPVDTLGRLNPDAIILIAGGTQAVSFIKAYRQRGFHGQIVGLSDVDPQFLIREAGPDLARGVGVSQVFPSLGNRIIPVVRDFQRAHQRLGLAGEPASLAAFEGYLSAKVIVEGLKRANVNRVSLGQALNSLGHFDLGGYVVNFSAAQHEGSSYADLLVIGSDGRIRY